MRFARRTKPLDSPKSEQRSSGTTHKAALPEHVHVFEANDEVTFAADHDVMVEIWRVRPTAESFARLDGYFRWLVERQPRVAALSIIDSPETPDAHAREAGAALIRQYSQNLVGVAFVIEGGSFKHTVIRFSLTTIDLLSSSTVPQPVFDQSEGACRWLSEVVPTRTTRERCIVVNSLRGLPPR
ncbi:MAG TPA: hypothetical protein VMF89_03085 [Polyangiales bacterium]|nr:hypothetical protein [Polyangiales bacterium]